MSVLVIMVVFHRGLHCCQSTRFTMQSVKTRTSVNKMGKKQKKSEINPRVMFIIMPYIKDKSEVIIKSILAAGA